MFKWITKRWEPTPLEKGMIESFQDLDRWRFDGTTYSQYGGAEIHTYFDNVLKVLVTYTPKITTLNMHGLGFIGGRAYDAFTTLHFAKQKEILENRMKAAEDLYADNP